MKKTILKAANYILLIPFLMVLYTIFIIDHNLAHGVVSGKYFWFYFSMALCTGSTLIYFFGNSRQVDYTLIDLLFSLFCIAGLTSSYLNNQTINTRLILMVLCFILYFYFKIAIKHDKSNNYVFILFLIITGLVEVVWGLRQLYGYSYSQHNIFKITGSLFNPGPYGGYLALIIPLAFNAVLRDYKVLGEKFSIKFIPFYVRLAVSFLTVLGIIIVLPASMSRASWLAAAGGCLCTGIIAGMNNKKTIIFIKKTGKKTLMIVSCCLVICAISGGFIIYNMKKDSADGRALMWKTSVSLIPKHPAGTGLGSFSGSYGEEQALYFSSGNASEQEIFVAGCPEYAFNEYFQIAVEMGIIPLLLYLATILTAFGLSIRNKRAGEVGAIISLSIFACMSYPYNILPFVIVLVYLLSSCSAITVNPVKKGSQKFIHKRIIAGCMLFISAIIVAVCLMNRYPTYEAYKKWRGSRMLYNMKLYKETAKEYKELKPYLEDQPNFMFEYGQSLSRIKEYEKGNDIIREALKINCDPMLYNIMGKNYQALKNYPLAEQAYIKAANLVPNRLYPYYLLANLYMESGDTLKAISTARIVLAKEPKSPSKAVDEMREEMKKITDKNH